MALTREFKDTVMELCKDPAYRKALLLEALEAYLDGDILIGNSLIGLDVYVRLGRRNTP